MGKARAWAGKGDVSASDGLAGAACAGGGSGERAVAGASQPAVLSTAGH